GIMTGRRRRPGSVEAPARPWCLRGPRRSGPCLPWRGGGACAIMDRSWNRWNGGRGEMLECQRAAFSLPESLHYLNCAYMAPLPSRVAEAGCAGSGNKLDPTGITPADFFTDSDRVRGLFGRLVNAPADRIAIIPAVSYGAALVAKNVECSRGMNVVVAHEQFPSNVYAWRGLCERTGAELRMVRPPADAG